VDLDGPGQRQHACRVMLVGDRSGMTAMELMDDVRARLTNRVQLTTDGLKAYPEAVEGVFKAGNMATACADSYSSPKFYNNPDYLRSGGSRPNYNPSMPFAASIKACTYRWLAAKCSRTVTRTILGETISFTANRGYPPCPGEGSEPTRQTDPHTFEEQNGRQVPTSDLTRMPRTTASGATFNIRIYGKLCRDNGHNCAQFRPGGATGMIGSTFRCVHANRFGYTATFAPASNCGPPEWPTSQLRDAYNNGDSRFPPYARWCDFTVEAQCDFPSPQRLCGSRGHGTMACQRFR